MTTHFSPSMARDRGEAGPPKSPRLAVSRFAPYLAFFVALFASMAAAASVAGPLAPLVGAA